MLGKLQGIVDEIGKDHILLNVMGIFFEIFIPVSMTKTLQIGENIKVQISMQIRESDISLYGFSSAEDKILFLELIAVKGVGPKMAVNLIGSLSYNEIIEALIQKDPTNLKKAPGVGGKLADRIVAEMQGKPLARLSPVGDFLAGSTEVIAGNQLARDAVSALVGLGFNRNQAFAICNNIVKDNSDITISEIIKIALKELAV